MAYSITNILTNLTATGDSTITDTATVTLAASTGYALPMTITVANADYSYDYVTGVISLSNPTADVTITATGLTQQERFNAVANGLVGTINDKAGTSGAKTLDEALQVAEGISTTKPEQTKTVALSMAGGDQVITPDSGKVLTQVTVEKPSTLTAGNIKDGVTIGGETGTFTHIESGGATASDILSGKKAYVNGAEVTGSIPLKSAATITPKQNNLGILAGQYIAGNQLIEGIVCSNLLSENIKDGVIVKIGTATDDDSVTTVVGSYTGGGGGGSLDGFSVDYTMHSFYGLILIYVFTGVMSHTLHFTVTHINETYEFNDTVGGSYDHVKICILGDGAQNAEGNFTINVIDNYFDGDTNANPKFTYSNIYFNMSSNWQYSTTNGTANITSSSGLGSVTIPYQNRSAYCMITGIINSEEA